MEITKKFIFNKEEFKVKDGYSAVLKENKIRVMGKDGSWTEIFFSGFGVNIMDEIYIGATKKDEGIMLHIIDDEGKIKRTRAKQLVQEFIDKLIEGLE